MGPVDPCSYIAMKTSSDRDNWSWLLRLTPAGVTLLALHVAYAADDPSFTRITMGTTVPSWGCAWADYNNDGYPDLFVSEGTWTTAAACSLYHKNQDGTFTEVTPDEAGDIVGFERYWMHGAWGDFDNDGTLDLFVTDSTAVIAIKTISGPTSGWEMPRRFTLCASNGPPGSFRNSAMCRRSRF